MSNAVAGDSLACGRCLIVQHRLREPKGSPKNKFTELAHRFRSDLAVPIERNHRNSNTLPGISRLRRGRR